MVVTFLPAMMLSGFIFDLRSMPAAVRAITYVLPARYFVALLQTVFLAGNVWSVVLPDTAILGAMVIVLLVLSRRVTRRSSPEARHVGKPRGISALIRKESLRCSRTRGPAGASSCRRFCNA